MHICLYIYTHTPASETHMLRRLLAVCLAQVLSIDTYTCIYTQVLKGTATSVWVRNVQMGSIGALLAVATAIAKVSLSLARSLPLSVCLSLFLSLSFSLSVRNNPA